MTRLSPVLSRALYLALVGLIAVAACVGLAAHAVDWAPVGWLLLALIVVVSVLRPGLLAGLVAAIIAALVFAAIVVFQHGISGDSRNASAVAILVCAAAFLLLPVLLYPLMSQERRLLQENADAARKIDDLTLRDEATGVYRSRYVETILDEEVERARRYDRDLTLCLIAIDNWRLLVGEYGAEAMREVVSKLERVLRARQRMLDKIVDLGDGEIALVLPETPLAGAEVVAGRIQSQISSVIPYPLRIGLTDLTSTEMTRESLIQEARQALQFARTANLPIVDRTFLAAN